MDIVKAKLKKNLIVKAWKRCRLARECSKVFEINSMTPSPNESSKRNKEKKKKGQVTTPVGCFSVYVGPQKQRFVVKTEFSNHPLFKELLEDAEMEYGYNCDGPLLLPCDVDLFYKVLVEMEQSNEDMMTSTPNCGYGDAYRLLSPSKMLKLNQF